MIRPFDAKDVQPYKVTSIDVETHAETGIVCGVGFAWQDEMGTVYYTAYDTLREWYDSYIRLLQKYHRDKYFLKRLTTIYAHNGANFDYLCFYSELYDSGAITDGQYFMADSAGLGASFEFEGRFKVKLMDSYRLMPASLAKLSDTFNVEKKKIKIDVLPHILKEQNPTLYWEYLKHDVLALQEIVYSFWKMIYGLFGNVGMLPMTLPSLVLRIFTKGLVDPILTPSHKKLKKLERDAYKGGLTLCLKTVERENVNVYDVNSMYPYVMQKEEYPASYVGYWTDRFKENVCGLWRASFNQTNENYPPILFDSKQGAAYCGNGVYTTQELNYLLKIGGTFDITEGYVYIETKTLFRQFINTIYKERVKAQERGDHALAFTLKIMMNSLYGKFAQREEGWSIKLLTADERIELMQQGVDIKIYGDFTAIKEERELPHVFVAIAAHITANARIDLHTRMCGMIDAGYEVLYCDTDSIHVVNGVMSEGSALGEVKLEYAGQAVYAGKKLYAIKDKKTKAKGIGRKTISRQDFIAGKKEDTPIGLKQMSNGASYEDIRAIAMDKQRKIQYEFTTAPSVKGVIGKTQKAAVFVNIKRKIKNTGGIWDKKE